MSLLDQMAGMPNAALPLPWLVTAGQPTAEQFTAAHAAGVRTVIDLRDPMEPRPLDEKGTLAKLGIEYVNATVSQGALTPATLDRILAALRANAGKPTLLHCASGNRTAGALIPYLILDEGMAEQDAVDTAMRIGLRSAELMEWGCDYARSHPK